MYHNEKLFNGQESESQLVFEVPGEPAVVINGVPGVTSAGVTCNHLDITYNPAPTDDPALGEWLEGRNVRKLFGGQYYSGQVVKYDCRTKWYRVVYEDGDSEDLEWHELEELLLPLDISVPLLALALGKCRSEKLVPGSRTNTRKNPMKGSMGRTLELLQAPHVNERKDQNLMEANFSTGKTQGALSMQREAQVENLENRLQGLQQKESVSEPRVKRKYTKEAQRSNRRGFKYPR
ncbi:uncharacterized protein M6B38_350530 [Iris pallida]|uniref:PTM/DIR17-like Tudor domain-containing protein n=1 Tax=Iris pallida TaxID=29817 RepID=A0AAX6GRF2_IRIPA|nr:uncharacterized protein M6B38_350530 [Iris pallida]